MWMPIRKMGSNTSPPPFLFSGCTTRQSKRDCNPLRPLFVWLDIDTIKCTFELTTQLARMPSSEILHKHFRAPNPALNIPRRGEALATDTLYSDVPAIGNGSTLAQYHVGAKTAFKSAWSLKSTKQFINTLVYTLEDEVNVHGAPEMLVSDSAQYKMSNRVKDCLRSLFTSNWQSEPTKQNQNLAEWHIQSTMPQVNVIMDRMGAPARVASAPACAPAFTLCPSSILCTLAWISLRVMDSG